MDDDFADRARRIRRDRGNDPIARHERAGREGRIRPVWLLIGILWGTWAMVHVKVINANYDALKTLAAEDQGFGNDFALRTLGATGSFALVVVLALIVLIFARRSWGFWNLFVGMIGLGIPLGGMLTKSLGPALMGPAYFP